MKRIFTALFATFAFAIACKKNDTPPTIPIINTSPLTDITTSSATAGGTITSNGGSEVTANGIVLSKKNNTPTINDTVVNATSTSGSFTVNLANLNFGTTYFIRAYATNNVGTAYGDVVTLNTTNDTTKVRFTYNGQTVTYGMIISPTTGKKWLDRNLGASQVATAYNDTSAYGDYFQWGRLADGHQLKTSGTTAVLSASDVPGHGNFILNGVQNTWYDWRVPQNDSLWQGNNGINNPCPTGWHVPTRSEWTNETAITDLNSAYANLKLTTAGLRNQASGLLEEVGSSALLWSASMPAFPEPHNSYVFLVNSSRVSYAGAEKRAVGFQIRCISN